MDPYLDSFHIRDLEQFTGIKAHTIRVWERRYGILRPGRTDTNIRRYDLDELRVLLNVAFLNRKGHKISRLAALTVQEREQMVRAAVGDHGRRSDVLEMLILAMLSFDERLFETTCEEFAVQRGFRALVEEVLVDLLERIGTLWQTSSICAAQEHFVSNLVRRRILAATHALPLLPTTGPVLVLHLPENEIHELGLLYADHVLRARGRRTVYLGQSVPVADLTQVARRIEGEVIFVSMVVVHPSTSELPAFLQALRNALPEERFRFLIAGAQLRTVTSAPAGMQLVPDLKSLVVEVDRM